MQRGVAEFLNLLLACGVISLVASGWHRHSTAKNNQLADDRPDEPYSVFTTKFDVEVNPRDASRLKALIPQFGKHQLEEAHSYPVVRSRSEMLYQNTIEEWQRVECELVTNFSSEVFSDAAIILLVDQSGSMRGEPIARATAMVRGATHVLIRLGADVEVLGFTTAGWRGGLAHDFWVDQGRPARPGRCCALLHVIYKRFDEPFFSSEAIDMMLDPRLLHENVDGESLQWAGKHLLHNTRRRKILVIISDGAPVDDATLLHNGEGFLQRHLLSVIAEVEEAQAIELVALGIGYDVNRYYKMSESARTHDDIASAAGSLLRRLAAHDRGESREQAIG